MAKKYQIVYNEESDYGQDVLNLAGLVGLLMDQDTPRAKYELYNIIDELTKASIQLRADVFSKKEPYFMGVE